MEGTIEATPEQLEKMSGKFTEVMFQIVMDRLNRGEEIPERREII